MKLTLVALAVPIFTGTAFGQNILSWNCNTLPDVCQNMCWGVKCSASQAAFTRLTWDRAGRDVKRDRRTAAGCLPGPNRCSVNAQPPFQAGFNCDEFPFASVREADQGSQWTRCVPEPQNNIRRNSQGWVLGRFYQSAQGCNNVSPCIFDQYFDPNTIPAGSHYCNANPVNVIAECQNNQRGAANQQENINGNNLAQNPTNWKRQIPPGAEYTFRMGSGINITTNTNWTIGANLVTISERQGSPEDQARWDQIYSDLEGTSEDDLDDFWGAEDDWDVSTDTVEQLVDYQEFGIIIS